MSEVSLRFLPHWMRVPHISIWLKPVTHALEHNIFFILLLSRDHHLAPDLEIISIKLEFSYFVKNPYSAPSAAGCIRDLNSALRTVTARWCQRGHSETVSHYPSASRGIR